MNAQPPVALKLEQSTNAIIPAASPLDNGGGGNPGGNLTQIDNAVYHILTKLIRAGKSPNTSDRRDLRRAAAAVTAANGGVCTPAVVAVAMAGGSAGGKILYDEMRENNWC